MNVVKPLPHLTLLRLQKAKLKVNTPNNSFVFHFPSISFSTTPPLLWPGLSLWQVPPFPQLHLGPACHCGRSRLVTPTPPPFSTLTFSTLRGGLSLWQVPPFPSRLSTPLSRPFFLSNCVNFLPSYNFHRIRPAFHHTMARPVIVAGPAIPFSTAWRISSLSSFPSSLVATLTAAVQVPPFFSPLHAPFMILLSFGPACHCGESRFQTTIPITFFPS